jgi:hypothetical protein
MAATWAPPRTPGLVWPVGGSGNGWNRPAGPPPGWGEGRRDDATTAPHAGDRHDPPPSLDLAIAFLKKRDGIDKLLKLVRYTAKLAMVTTHAVPVPAVAASFAGGAGGWATSPAHPLPPPTLFFTPARLGALESSIGDARKAYRLGKWLQGVAAFRDAGGVEALSGRRGLPPALAAAAAAGEALYFFLEQGTWLVRARVVDAALGPAIARTSAVAELASYAGSSALALVSLDGLAAREVSLRRALAAARSAWPGSEEEVPGMLAELERIPARRTALRLALLQDACDALLAAADLKRRKGGLLDSKPLLAGAGLCSAVLGTRKVWLAMVKGRDKMSGSVKGV